MSEIKIEKDVPIPTRARAGMPLPDLSKMAVGDSFVLPAGTVKHPRSNALTRARQWALTHKKMWEFRTAAVEGGTRIWRIE